MADTDSSGFFSEGTLSAEFSSSISFKLGSSSLGGGSSDGSNNAPGTSRRITRRRASKRTSSGHLSCSSLSGSESRTTIRRPSSRESLFLSESMETLTVNKLRFSALGLHGRDEELGTLLDCLKRVVAPTTPPQQKEQQQQELATSVDDHVEQTATMTSKRQPERRKQLVLISGLTGTGKTRLALALRKPVVRKYKGLCIVGKFDAQQTTPVPASTSTVPSTSNGPAHSLPSHTWEEQPYQGLTRALEQLCSHIVNLQVRDKPPHNNPERTFETIRSKLLDQLNESELRILTKVIPGLQDIVCSSYNSSNNDKVVGTVRGGVQDGLDNQGSATGVRYYRHDARTQFQFAFCRLIRVLSPLFAPLVLILDDLQWADTGSLQLIETIMADQKCPNVMCVGCYRTDHLSSTNINSLRTMISELSQEKNDRKFDVTQVSIGSLGVHDAHQIVMDLLSTDDNRTLSLAQICHRKTNGVVFFLIDFLAMLYKRGLLEYKIGLLKWVWNDEEIETKAVAADNVIDLVKDKLTSLPSNVSRILQLAACLGASFDERTLCTVFLAFDFDDLPSLSTNVESSECHPHKSSQQDSFDYWMGLAVKEGFFERDGPTSYRWVHGRIQEAAFSLISEDEVKSLQSRVGEILVSGLSDEELDDAIFAVVNLFNEGSSPVKEIDRIKLARLNLQASIKAAECSAFESASEYAAKGIDLLPSDRWRNHYELSLDLFSTAAEIVGALGRYDELEKHYFNEVIAQKDRPLLDKIRVYNALLDSVAIQDGRGLEAVDLCKDVLRQLGCRFPKGKKAMAFSTLTRLMRIKATIKSRTPQEISRMPLMTDPKQIETMRLLNKLASYCYKTAHGLFPLVVLESLRLTLRHGLCDSAPATFSLIGMLLTGILEDFQGGAVYAEQALLLLDRLDAVEVESRTLRLTHFFVLPWTKPAQAMMKPLLKAYEVGMQVGDTESALVACGDYLLISLQSGRSIVSLEADCRTYVEQMDELRRERTSRVCKVTWQAILNLMGRSNDPTVMTGEVMDQEALIEHASESNLFLLLSLYGHQALLYAFFGEHKLGAELAIAHGGTVARDLPCHPFVAMCPFYMGISLFEMARKTKLRKYKVPALKCLTTVTKFVKRANPNVRHHMSLLEAESAALRGDNYIAMGHFETAVVLSVRSGFVQDAALIHERFGEFLLSEMSNQLDAAFRLEEAIKLYDEWGARKKADLLREKYSHILPRAFGC